MNVIAKMRVASVKNDPEYGGKNVHLSAVVDGSEENRSFSKYTPSAELGMWISDETPASEFFKEGDEIYLTFSKER